MQTRKLTVSIDAKHMRRILAVMAFGLALCVMLIGSGNGASAGVPVGIPTANQAGKIEPVVLQDTTGGKSTSVMVLLADQANVDAANSMQDQDARGWYVYNTLTRHAQSTQASLRASLDAQGVKYRSFWAVNAVAVTVDRTLLETLAARSDVGKIESNRQSRWIEDPDIANFGVANDSPEVIELGVQNVNAPQVWAMGFTGQGIVIGNQDTGVRWTHNAIKPKYRGWNGAIADHNYNWWDAIHSGGGSCGPNTIVPCDDQGHGTHTTGTTSGDDGAGNQIGVAPGAKWIGCRNMNVGVGTPATYTECFEFFIAPTDLTGNNPNPALRPHVMNNSWGCPPSEGCAANSLETIVNNTVAAGIFVVVSAGNAGSACSSVNDPPAIYASSFSIGAISASTNAIASFSSRGPVTVDGSNRMKPDISAPGVSVRSSTRSGDTTYGSLSGTSMAGPHAVGVVALLWSARPQLERDIPNTRLVLQNSANPNVVVSPVQTCGGIPSSQIPNNTFGWGRVDALAAVNSVQQGTPTPTTTGTPPTATRTSTATNTVVVPTGTATAVTCPVFSEGFESGTLGQFNSVVAQCVPGGCGWTSSTTSPHSGTRSAFEADRSNITDVYLQLTNPVSPMAGSTLTFWHSYNLEDTFDGGVLESSTNGGTTWVDMQPNITGGGYTDTISSSFGSPISGRMAWSGNSGGYVQTTVNLTPYAGQSLLFRFRLATDNSVSGVGWFIDDIAVSGTCATGTPVAPTATNTTIAATATTTRTNTPVPPTATNTAVVTSTNTAVAATATATCVPVGSTLDVSIDDFFFAPSSITIPAGTTIRWTNVTTQGIPHTSTSDTAGVWDSGTLDQGEQFSFTFNTPGTYPYHCDFHPEMTGTITVQAGGLCVTSTSTAVPTATRTNTPVPPTATRTTAPTQTPGGPTATTEPSQTPVPPSSTPTVCTITFSDVDPDNIFYSFIRCLACRFIISGYDDGTFRPFNDITRGQIAKMVSNAAGFDEDPGPQVYEDTPPASPFYQWINRLSNRGHMGGYPCGLLPDEPCIEPDNLPYFRPSNSATRGQLSKIVSNAAGLDSTPSGQFYTDVDESHPFYLWIMRLTELGVMSGYECGGEGEPCDSENRPYFRPYNNVTRGQASKIVANTFYPNCQTPSR